MIQIVSDRAGRQAPSTADTGLRFVLVGIWNTVFGIAVFGVADRLLRDLGGYPVALTVMFAVAIPQAHLAQRLFVWHSRSPYLPELARFSSVFVVTYVVNLVLLVLAVEVLHVAALPAQAVISIGTALASFVIHRSWTFRHRHTAGDRPAMTATERV